ncbi:c-type cytochrome [Salinisphaera aquimarina]|uniref:C-type cytochrome n=1 Tax=Salinisphaera aquimarina TaxID=2094031 RepID=A0ABV7EMA2_9GAMM
MTKRFIVLFGLIVCAGAVSADPLMDGDVDAGQQKAAVCAACHGPKGNMVSPQFPKLAGQGAPYIYEQLKLFKSGERKNGIMMGQASGLSDEDMKNLAVYFASQQTRPGAADIAVAPAGAALYHSGKADKNIPACSGCHGPSGMGNAAAKFPRLSGQNPQYIVTQLTAYRDGTRSDYHNATIMNGVAENLSDTDIKALASYVAGLGQSDGKSSKKDYGALMQNAGGPGAAKASGDEAGNDGSDNKAGGDTSTQAGGAAGGDAKQADKADAAAKQKAGSAAGNDTAADQGGNADTSKPADDAGKKAGADSTQQ